MILKTVAPNAFELTTVGLPTIGSGAWVPPVGASKKTETLPAVKVLGSIGRSKVTRIVLASVVPSVADFLTLSASPLIPTGPWVLAMIRGPAERVRIALTIFSRLMLVGLFWFDDQNGRILPLTTARAWWSP